MLLDANTNYWGIAHAQREFSGSWRLNSEGAMRLTAGQTNGDAWNLRPDDEIFALRVEGNRAVARTGNALSCRIESDGVAAKKTHHFLMHLYPTNLQCLHHLLQIHLQFHLLLMNWENFLLYHLFDLHRHHHYHYHLSQNFL